MQRRTFLTRSLVTAGLAGILATRRAPAQQPRGANEVIQIGVIGCGGRGNEVTPSICRVPGVHLAGICDIDPQRVEAATEKWKEFAGGQRPRIFGDYRELLGSGELDAVVITTPNHWHAPMAIAACRAGLDVYVEKPVCHNVAEGRLMVQVARETQRIVMAGTQNRADTSIHEAKKWAAENAGDLGALVSAHAFWYNVRQPIGKVTKPTPVGEGIDYDLFQGPRPLVPLMRKNLHYDWHWQWETGSGELGNTGIHVLDHTRFFLDLTGWPKALQGVGGRLIGVDDGQSPSDHLVGLDYGLGVPFTLEVRNLPERKGSTNRCAINRSSTGTIATYENGSIQFDRGGSRVFEAGSGRPKQTWGGDSGMRIFANFIDCVRSRRREDQYADIEQGYISTAICHFANAAHRIGEQGVTLEQAAAAPLLTANAEIWKGYGELLVANEVDLGVTPLTLSPRLTFDGETERCVGDEAGTMANMLASEVQRAPYGVL